MSDEADDGESFLSRWSRLKRTKPAAPAAAAAAPEAEAPPEDEAAEAAPETPPEAVSEEPPPDLPDVETLGRDSDYKPFLAANVPTALRNAALRKLWRSDPVFANLDGLNDYDGDFTIASNVATKVADAVERTFDAGRKLGEKVDSLGEPPRRTALADGGGTAEDTEEAGDRNGSAAPPPVRPPLSPPDADA